MDYRHSPFHRFRGWHILALMAVTVLYSYWFTVIGPYAKLAGLAPGMPLEEHAFYSGAHAVDVLGQLGAAGEKAKLISLLCDIPFMILMALTFEALIGFGIRRMKLIKPIWSLLFILPILCLLVDFSEDSFLALTLVTKSEILGSIAGFFTGLKFWVFYPTSLISLVMGVAGLCVWIMSRFRKSAP
jgi:hypothetical protein